LFLITSFQLSEAPEKPVALCELPIYVIMFTRSVMSGTQAAKAECSAVIATAIKVTERGRKVETEKPLLGCRRRVEGSFKRFVASVAGSR